ncbi:hypothetical protein PRUB_a0079 [Pseudoalteromonas rubra]|uniref:Pvc16 N-terminal domain-containing protein n=1 Tax=Pseudoalteromonas rubra TaxID=43658 RepID=A0A8T0C4S9_9GAMM|nr:Pvc16 family protein [Pseudoalteromonas rubra]KAF7785714.1 hypothetical protein PRUB_a0079 [Pseudoalteromonas rubra]
MITQVIDAFKNELNQALLQGMISLQQQELDSVIANTQTSITAATPKVSADADKIEFIDPGQSPHVLHKNKVNLVLFSSQQESAFNGGNPLGYTITPEAKARPQKAPLHLSLNMLLIFNQKDYSEGLKFYEIILRHLYSNSILLHTKTGDKSAQQSDWQVDVVLSHFSAREELEIWNNFNVSGLPLLRYELNWVRVSALAKKDVPLLVKTKIEEGEKPAPFPTSNLADSAVSTLLAKTKQNMLEIIWAVAQFNGFATEDKAETDYEKEWPVIIKARTQLFGNEQENGVFTIAIEALKRADKNQTFEIPKHEETQEAFEAKRAIQTLFMSLEKISNEAQGADSGHVQPGAASANPPKGFCKAQYMQWLSALNHPDGSQPIQQLLRRNFDKFSNSMQASLLEQNQLNQSRSMTDDTV